MIDKYNLYHSENISFNVITFGFLSSYFCYCNYCIYYFYYSLLFYYLNYLGYSILFYNMFSILFIIIGVSTVLTIGDTLYIGVQFYFFTNL